MSSPDSTERAVEEMVCEASYVDVPLVVIIAVIVGAAVAGFAFGWLLLGGA